MKGLKKILLIEDEDSIRIAFATVLNMEGYQTLTAEDGRKGIETAREHMPDLIVCDVSMPGGISGYDVLAALHEDPDTAGIPFIFLTGMADRANLRKGMVLGADDYLTKPCTRNELLEAIATRLAR